MKKDYQAPDMEVISLAVEEVITDSNMDGNLGTNSNTLFPGM